MLVNIRPPTLLSLPRLSGTVVGALLNDPAQLIALGNTVHLPPHKAPPRAPVLAVRPRHMLAANGAEIEVPAGVPALGVGPSLGIVIGRTACRVNAAQALGFVAGYVVAAEVCVPLTSHYRPAVRQTARDRFCPLGDTVIPTSEVGDPAALRCHVVVDGVRVESSTTVARVRGAARLIADVTEFMTLQAGDVLLLGAGHAMPLVKTGQTFSVLIDGVGTLTHRLVEEAVAS